MFATFAGRFISVASKGLKVMVGSPDPVGICAPRLVWSFDGAVSSEQWSVGRREGDGEWEIGAKPRNGARGRRG